MVRGRRRPLLNAKPRGLASLLCLRRFQQLRALRVGRIEVVVGRLGDDEEVVPGVEVPRLASHRRRHLRQRVHLRRRAFEVHRVGGRLALYADQWVFAPWAYDVTSRGLRWEWIGAPPSYRPFYQAATPLLESFVQTLLDSGAIEKTSFLAFQGPLFSVAKKGTDKRRVILDLSTLNKHVLCASFKMTTVERVRLILPQGVWTVSLDPKEAYYHVPSTQTTGSS